MLHETNKTRDTSIEIIFLKIVSLQHVFVIEDTVLCQIFYNFFSVGHGEMEKNSKYVCNCRIVINFTKYHCI